jgi:hypothetical protein
MRSQRSHWEFGNPNGSAPNRRVSDALRRVDRHDDSVVEHSFVANDGVVLAKSADRTVWSAKVLGVSAIDAFSLPGTADGIVVLDWMDRPEGVEPWHPYGNVLRISAHGKVVWQAEPPSAETSKSFTSAKWENGKLVAHTWNFVCELDPETGAILNSTFTK